MGRSHVLLPSKAFESNFCRSLSGPGSTLTFWTKKESAADECTKRIRRVQGVWRIGRSPILSPRRMLNLAFTALRLFALWQLGLDSHLIGRSEETATDKGGTRINDSKGFKGIPLRVQKRRNHNQEVDTPKADKKLRHRRNREPKVKQQTSYAISLCSNKIYRIRGGRSSHLHQRHAVGSGNVKQTKRIRI